MIPIDKLPALNWTDNSAFEIEESGGNELLAISDCAWQIRDILVVGLIYSSLVNPPWMWFALSKNVTFSDLIDFRQIKDYIPKGTLTAVAEDFPIARRFAQFYGFEKTDDVHIFKGRNYLIYRRT